MVTRALIPCGGRGTRMTAVSGGRPKELVTIAGMPVVERVARECAASGIAEVLVVISPAKTAIVDLLEPLQGKTGMPESISFAVQQQPRGLADAIRVGSSFAAGEPIGVALPDNLFSASQPALSQVIQTHAETGKSVVAMVEIHASEAWGRGPTSIYEGRLTGAEFVIEHIPEKRDRGGTFDLEGAQSAFTGVGRYVFTPDVFSCIDEVEGQLPPGAELDDVPVMKRLLQYGRLTGRRITGSFFDVGIVSGYQEADSVFRSGSRQMPARE